MLQQQKANEKRTKRGRKSEKQGKCRWQMRLASRFPFEARAARVCVCVCIALSLSLCVCVCVLMLCFDKPQLAAYWPQ